jgi:hypothetical protein
MTIIIGYISQTENDNSSLFLTSDGRVQWHELNHIQEDYPKIKSHKNLLISFNGDVGYYQDVINTIKKSNTICNISSLENYLNNNFPYNQYIERNPNRSHSRYSNIIVMDIKNRELAFHYGGDVWNSTLFHGTFNFKKLPPNNIYHFGSVISFMNQMAFNGPISYKEEEKVINNSSISSQKQICNEIIEWAQGIDNLGIGRVEKFYFKDEDGNVSNNIKLNLMLILMKFFRQLNPLILFRRKV